jgi:hypothetical protein
VGNFTGLWPNSKVVESWVLEHWCPKVKGTIRYFVVGRGYFIFTFFSKSERDIIFRSGPYFMGSRGMFLSPWSLDFNPEDEISTTPVWVRLPFLPLIFWEENYFRAIGNKLGRYIDWAEPKGNQYSYAIICVEVDLEKGLPEAVQIKIDDWSFQQPLDYEHIPFKCHICHDHGHFAKNFPKLQQSQPPPIKESEFKMSHNQNVGIHNVRDCTTTPAKKTKGSLKNNQFGALENLGDAKNLKEQGKDPGNHPSNGFDCPLEEPIINPKVDKKEDVSAEEEGDDVRKVKEKDGDDSEETEEEDSEANEESEEEEVEAPKSKVAKNFQVKGIWFQKCSLIPDPSKSFSFVDALKNYAPNPSPPLTRGRKSKKEQVNHGT